MIFVFTRTEQKTTIKSTCVNGRTNVGEHACISSMHLCRHRNLCKTQSFSSFYCFSTRVFKEIRQTSLHPDDRIDLSDILLTYPPKKVAFLFKFTPFKPLCLPIFHTDLNVCLKMWRLYLRNNIGISDRRPDQFKYNTNTVCRQVRCLCKINIFRKEEQHTKYINTTTFSFVTFILLISNSNVVIHCSNSYPFIYDDFHDRSRYS